MTGAVLDASAILAMLLSEAGADVARRAMQGGRVSAVNYAEVVSKLIDRPYTPEETRIMLDALSLVVVPFEASLAFQTGLLRRQTRKLGLSLGDRACLALALREKLPVFTADRRWAELDIGVEIRLVR